jgi:hypothetical protein
MKNEWFFWVDERRRHNLFRILEELSVLHSRREGQFILIGALSLLIRGMLRYVVQWDMDLLFRSEDALNQFVSTEKSEGLRIVNYDEQLMRGESIASLHTAWSFDETWFNVDYILKPDMFAFYHSSLAEEGTYERKLDYEGVSYHFNLLVAHPWDVFIEKLLSVRLRRELEARDSMSVDVRHALRLFEVEKSKEEFWNFVSGRVDTLGKKSVLKENLLELLSSRAELGYASVEVPDHIYRRLRTL